MNPLCFLLLLSNLAADPPAPKVHDDRLQITLFAIDPQVTTPTGIAVDDKGVVYVVENNTHFRPKDYQRAELDRILRMHDTDGDGRADKIEEFFTGLKNTMSIAFDLDGSLLVATRNEVFRLRDRDGDGKAEERTDLIKLETKGDYPHNGLSGFAQDFRGNIYFGFGENLGADYTLRGTDGGELKGGNEGGNIYCCDPAGKKLLQVATGFWNPFHLTFDTFGRLFTVDNDPDSRPPCRLIHVVEGGDYGFRFRNGRKGVSPFTAWNGELPATLPMVCGTGEAPCAVMAYESDNLPDEYRGELLVTSWGDHRLERYTLKPRGASFSAEMKPILTGDQNFRPVGLALAPDGSLYMSDWVDKSYPIHGKGRIWRLKAKNPPKRQPLSDEPALALAHPHRPWREGAARKLTREQAVEVASKAKDERARSAAAKQVFAANSHWLAATVRGNGPPLWNDYEISATLEDIALLTETMARYQPTHLADLARLGELIAKQAAGQRITTAENKELDQKLESAFPADLEDKTLSAELLRQILVVSPNVGDDPLAPKLLRDPWVQVGLSRLVESMDPTTYLNRSRNEYRQFQRTKPVAETKFTFTPKLSNDLAAHWKGQRFGAVWEAAAFQRLDEASLRPMATVMLGSGDADLRFIGIRWAAESKLTDQVPALEKLLETESENARNFGAILLALDRISGRTHENTGEYFAAKFLISSSKSVPAKIMALRMVSPNHPDVSAKFLIELTKHDDKTLQREAVRALRLRGGEEALARLREIVNDDTAEERLRCEAVLALSPTDSEQRHTLMGLSKQQKYASLQAEAKRLLADVEVRTKLGPKDLPAWQKLTEGDGDPVAGERLFFHPKVATCFKCHEYRGRGGRVGPDLSTIAKSMTRERLLQSIVDPSREIAPQFTTWTIQANDGTVKTGVYVGEEVDGTVRYADAEGKIFKLHPRDVEDRKASDKSIMPEGLPATLTPQELRDLLAFLLQN